MRFVSFHFPQLLGGAVMLRFISLFLMIPLVLSCSPTYFSYHRGSTIDHLSYVEKIPVWLDKNFTAEQIEQIRGAIKEWNLVLNGQIVFQLVEKEEMGIDKKKHLYPVTFDGREAGKTLENNPTGQGIVVYALKKGDKELKDSDVTDGMLAWVNGPGTRHIMVVIDRVGNRNLKTIIMHEIAHLLGAQHVSARSLENNYAGRYSYDCIDKITVAQVAAYQHLELHSLGYCITPDFE
jgi:hypothetical protein